MLQGSPTLRFEFLAEALVVTRRSLEVLVMCQRPFAGRHDVPMLQKKLRTVLWSRTG